MTFALAKRVDAHSRRFVASVTRKGVDSVRVPDPYADGYQERFDGWRIRRFKTRAAAESVLAKMQAAGYGEYKVEEWL